jgi:hypothetical protein
VWNAQALSTDGKRIALFLPNFSNLPSSFPSPDGHFKNLSLKTRSCDFNVFGPHIAFTLVNSELVPSGGLDA